MKIFKILGVMIILANIVKGGSDPLFILHKYEKLNDKFNQLIKNIPNQYREKALENVRKYLKKNIKDVTIVTGNTFVPVKVDNTYHEIEKMLWKIESCIEEKDWQLNNLDKFNLKIFLKDVLIYVISISILIFLAYLFNGGKN